MFVNGCLLSLDKQGIAAELNKDYNQGALEMFVESGTQFTAAFNRGLEPENAPG